MPYIISTLSSDQKYTIWRKTEGGIQRPKSSITIHGKANIAQELIRTPKGIMTTITDEQLETLEKDIHFQRHVAGGFLTVEKRKADPEKVSKDMTRKDKSAPLTPTDFPAEGPQPNATEEPSFQKEVGAQDEDDEEPAPKKKKRKAGRPRKSKKD